VPEAGLQPAGKMRAECIGYYQSTVFRTIPEITAEIQGISKRLQISDNLSVSRLNAASN
jgi:hypothetical protein